MNDGRQPWSLPNVWSNVANLSGYFPTFAFLTSTTVLIGGQPIRPLDLSVGYVRNTTIPGWTSNLNSSYVTCVSWSM